MSVTGEPLPGGCAASIGLALRVDSTADEVDVAPGDGTCRSISNRCTLRAAVMESNAHQGHDRIEVPSGRYALSLTGTETADVPNDAIGDLDITDGLTLSGLGHAAKNDDLQVIIDGGAIDRIFDIYAAAPRAVTLSYLRLENGRPMGSGGGAIWNRGNLRMDRMLLRGNTIDHELETSCAAFPSRRLCNRGAGLFNEGQALVARSTIEQNSTGYESGHGGGISNMGSAAQLYLRNSLITANDARFWGGLLNYQGTVDILNSTFVDNRSTTRGVSAAEIGNVDGKVTVRNATFSNHSQLFSHTGTGEFRLANSLGEVRAFNDMPFCSGTLTSGSFNAIGAPEEDFSTSSGAAASRPLLRTKPGYDCTSALCRTMAARPALSRYVNHSQTAPTSTPSTWAACSARTPTSVATRVMIGSATRVLSSSDPRGRHSGAEHRQLGADEVRMRHVQQIGDTADQVVFVSVDIAIGGGDAP